MSVDILIEKIRAMNNPSVAGLDPKLSYIPDFILNKAAREHGETFEAAAAAILEYNRGLIDALCDVVPAVKPQSAYYEMYGPAGVLALRDTMAYASEKGMYVIADVKRNDIGSTAEAYAEAYLGETELFGTKQRAFPADAATVNAYLGTDGIEPFLTCCKAGRMIFVLVKTSNPSSGEFQDRQIGGSTLFELVGDKVAEYGRELKGSCGYTQVGAVVGATYPEQLANLRRRLPDTFFLVPGYGAQGGGAAGVAPAFDKNGLGAVVNSSRAILCAWQKEKCQPEDYAGAARREALRMREDLNGAILG